MEDDEFETWAEAMGSNDGLAAGGHPAVADCSSEFDDLAAEHWEDHFGGPDDSCSEFAEYDETPESREVAERYYPASLRQELNRLRNRTVVGTYDSFMQAAAVARRSSKYVVARADSTSSPFVVFYRKG
jgi:hypothetical protein